MTAAFIAATTSGTTKVPVTELGYTVDCSRKARSIICFVISKYCPPLLVAMACSDDRSAPGGAIAIT